MDSLPSISACSAKSWGLGNFSQAELEVPENLKKTWKEGHRACSLSSVMSDQQQAGPIAHLVTGAFWTKLSHVLNFLARSACSKGVIYMLTCWYE